MVAVSGLYVHAQTPHVCLCIFIRHVLFVFLLFKFTSITQFLSSASLSPYRSAFNQSGTLGENRTEKYEESYFSGRRNAFCQLTLVRYLWFSNCHVKQPISSSQLKNAWMVNEHLFFTNVQTICYSGKSKCTLNHWGLTVDSHKFLFIPGTTIFTRKFGNFPLNSTPFCNPSN